MQTHIRTLLVVLCCQDIPQHIDRGIRLDSNTGLHALVVDKSDEFARACRTGRLVGGFSGRGGIDGCFVVEAVEVASGFLEVPNPFMRLTMRAH